MDGVDERNIEEYLQRHNIVTMQDRVMTKVRQQQNDASIVIIINERINVAFTPKYCKDT